MLEPTLAEVIRAALEAHAGDLHTSTVCRVEKYDATKQVVDCVPVIRRPLENAVGDVEHEEICVIPNVPVAWPRAGGFFIHLPLEVGDHVLVVFTHDNIGTWRQTGSVSDPGDRSRHSLSSCIAIPGIASMLSPLSPLDADARSAGLVLGKDGSAEQILVAEGEIRIGKLAVSPVALAVPTDANFAAHATAIGALVTTVGALSQAYGNHVHPVTAAPGTTGTVASPPEAPAPAPAPPGSTAATMVKAQ